MYIYIYVYMCIYIYMYIHSICIYVYTWYAVTVRRCVERSPTVSSPPSDSAIVHVMCVVPCVTTTVKTRRLPHICSSSVAAARAY